MLSETASSSKNMTQRLIPGRNIVMTPIHPVILESSLLKIPFYLIGGNSGLFQRAVGYNPSANELFYTNYQLYKCVNPDTCVVNNELYMNVNSKNCLEVYNPSLDIWYYTPPRPKTNETGICPFDDKIYCFGGNIKYRSTTPLSPSGILGNQCPHKDIIRMP